MVIFITYSLGTMLNGVMFKYLNREHVFIFYFIIPTILMLFGLKIYVKETPFDLVTKFTP